MEVLRVVSGRLQLGDQAAKWQESLIAAESGVDLAVLELRKSLYPAPNQRLARVDQYSRQRSNQPRLDHSADPGSGRHADDHRSRCRCAGQLIDPSNGWQSYRIRTLGAVPLSGPPRTGYNKQDNSLRKLTLQTQRFIDDLFSSETSAPHAARRLEAIVNPSSAFNLAILSVGTLDLNNHNIIIDSYDSRDSAKSTNGLYDVTKRQQNGDIATDGRILDAGGAYVYGSVSTNSGTATGVQNVTGEQRTDFYQAPIPISDPSWPSINPTPSTVNGNVQSPPARPRGRHHLVTC